MSLVHENCKLRPCSEHTQNMTCCVHKLFFVLEQFMYKTCSEHVLRLQFLCTELVIQWSLLSYCGLEVNARVSASEKYLPVPT